MIGIFDSGSGGLSVLREIRKRMPQIDVVYLGDIKNAPYGSKTREELGALTVMSVNRLMKEGAEKIVSACNSVSASIVLPMIDLLGIAPKDLIEMVGPTVRSLRDVNGQIAIAATPATIESGLYQNGFRLFNKETVTIPIRELAPAIEFGAKEEDLKRIIVDALKDTNFDTLVLACTHYPLVLDVFEETLRGSNTRIVDPAIAVAEEVKKRMNETGEGKTRFLITEDSDYFRQKVKDMFGERDIIIEVI